MRPAARHATTRFCGALALALLLMLGACSNPPYPRGSIETLYPQPPRPTLKRVALADRQLQFAEMPASAAAEGGTPLLFVHGSPGDWKAWARYLDAPELAGEGTRIAVDRPGYGGSGAGAVMTDLRAQAALLAQLIPPGPPAILIGHSLGAPLVGWIALDDPDKVCGVVMIAGSIAPAQEAPRWYNRAADTWLARLLLPDELLWSNQEILPLKTELQKLDREWPRLQRPVIIIQGEKDSLVDPRTADYAERRLPAQWRQVVRVADGGHFLLWKQPGRVIEAIRSLHCPRATAGLSKGAER